MKYNIGDKVRIRNLEVNDVYGEVYVIDEMLEYCGKIVEIEKINNTFNDRYYILKDCKLLWHGDMLEPIKVETKKTSLEKALELLNMTEEEVKKEYDKKDITELGVEITNKFNYYCNSRWKCRGCKYKEYGKTNCNIMFVLNYLKDKEMLILPTKEDDR